MSSKLYHVIYTGKLATGMDAATVKSNLILDVGLPEDKADLLLSKARVLIKRFPTSVEAEMMAGQFERAGALCCIECHSGNEGGSSLVSFIKKINPIFRRSSSRSGSSRKAR